MTLLAKNTAMVQTGHRSGKATEYERQVLSNTICYLYQRTPLQYSYDNSVIDMPKLDMPKIIESSFHHYCTRNCDTFNEEHEISHKIRCEIKFINLRCEISCF